MKSPTLFNLALERLIVPVLFSFLLLAPQPVMAEGSYPESSEPYSRAELAQMLAPIALYPDALLSQVLMASTYPIEVIEADRWVRKNQGLRGEALDRALVGRDWDPSVKAICHFPSILSLMSDRISETTELGNAFLAQESEVMETVQDLRSRAYAEGNLVTNDRQKVIVEQEAIIIQPAYPRIVYVPYYDPFIVYGSWWYPAYPPWYWGPTGIRIGIGISYWPGFYFHFAFGNWCYFDWHHDHIVIDVRYRPIYVRHDHWIVKTGRWNHSPYHRRGIAYRDWSTAEKYDRHIRFSRQFQQRDTRDFNERRKQEYDGGRVVHERTPIEQKQNRAIRQSVDPVRQQRQHVERSGQFRKEVVHDRQERQQVRQPVQQNRQAPKVVVNSPRQGPKVEVKRQQPVVAGNPPTAPYPERAKRLGVDGEHRQRGISDTISNRGGNGRWGH